MQDYLGNPVSATHATTRRAIDDFIEGYLAYETRAESIVAAAEADRGCCIANVYAGLSLMLLEAPGAARHAGRYLDAAERAAAATPRELQNVALLRAWVADDLGEVLRLCEALCDAFPRDLVIVKTHQYLEFNRGNPPAMLRAALKVSGRNADIAYMHGMIAFAYEQCHLLEEAELAARAALALRRKEPWAQHALAHVMLTRGQIDAGACFLESVRDTWTGLNSFMITHLWWHLALFYLSQGRWARVLHVYDRYCWAFSRDYSQDQVGAISLLTRMEVAGMDVGARWQDLSGHVASRAHDTVLPFLTMQYLYCLARAQRPEADVLLQSVRHAAHNGAPFTREVWRDVALPACEGLYAYAKGDFHGAWRQLGPAMPRMAEVGGSHAQRDLFEQILLDAAIRSGRWAQAQRMLEQRRVYDPGGVPVNTSLAGLYARLGLPDLAGRAGARAAGTLSRHRE